MDTRITFSGTTIKKIFSGPEKDLKKQCKVVDDPKKGYPINEPKNRLDLILDLKGKRNEIDRLKKNKKSLEDEKNSMDLILLIKKSSFSLKGIKLSFTHPMLIVKSLILFCKHFFMENNGEDSAQKKNNECVENIYNINEKLKTKETEMRKLSISIGWYEGSEQRSQKKNLNLDELYVLLCANDKKAMALEEKFWALDAEMDEVKNAKNELNSEYLQFEKNVEYYQYYGEQYGTLAEREELNNAKESINEKMMEIDSKLSPISRETNKLYHEANDLLWQMITG